MPFDSAVVAYANYFQFGPGEVISYPYVESRMLVWVRRGHGRIKVNDQMFDMGVNQFLFLPWGHAISYYADQRNPFLSAGIHVIPVHERNRPMDYSVAHRPGDALERVPWRRDSPELSEIPGIVSDSLNFHLGLHNLAEHILQVFLRGAPPEWIARQQARLLLNELMTTVRHVGAATNPVVPESMQRIMEYVLDHLNQPIGLEELMTFSEMSTSTIGRHFRQHLGVTPGEWILRKKIEKAQQLLRTTRLAVSEVGRRVGIDDAYYFSKLFKKKVGVPPLAWRRMTHRL